MLYAQPDTLVVRTADLPEVLLSDSLPAKAIAPLTVAFTPATVPGLATRNVADVLAEQGEVFIKSYGLGSLATVSVQGGAASQVAIQWNGIALQSPMLGLTDLALLPAMGLQSLTLQAGGQSATSGSGGICGGIYLRTAKPDAGLSAAYHTRVGSFGYWQHQVALAGGTDRLRFSVHGQHTQAENDFLYRPQPGLPERRQIHAQLHQQVFQQALFWEIAPKQSLHYYGWQQQGQRNLPPTTTQTRSEATQQDALHRHLLLWQARARSAVWESRLAYAHERIHFQDPRQGIDSPSRFQSWTLQPKRSAALSDRLHHTVGAQWTLSRAEIANYRGYRQLSQAGLYSQWLYAYAYGQIEGAVRLESTDWTNPIPVFNVAINRKWGRKIQMAVGGGRDFRTPSLNDLYWIPGGNPTLLPELAWSQFAALDWTHTGAGGGRLYIRLHGYNRTVSNWIQWAQQDGNAYWSASNVAKVWSRGMEPRIAWERPIGRGQLKIWTQYFLSRSTHQNAIQNPAIARGDQLWYTPVHRTASGISYQRRQATLRFTHHYTGKTAGTLAPLPDWHWAQVEVSSRHTWRRLAIEWHIEANNIFNADYRIIERRPMPGRHFAVGAKIGVR